MSGGGLTFHHVQEFWAESLRQKLSISRLSSEAVDGVAKDSGILAAGREGTGGQVRRPGREENSLEEYNVIDPL